MELLGIYDIEASADLDEDQVGQLVQRIIDPIDSRIRFQLTSHSGTHITFRQKKQFEVRTWTISLLPETITSPKEQTTQIETALIGCEDIFDFHPTHLMKECKS